MKTQSYCSLHSIIILLYYNGLYLACCPARRSLWLSTDLTSVSAPFFPISIQFSLSAMLFHRVGKKDKGALKSYREHILIVQRNTVDTFPFLRPRAFPHTTPASSPRQLTDDTQWTFGQSPTDTRLLAFSKDSFISKMFRHPPFPILRGANNSIVSSLQ